MQVYAISKAERPARVETNVLYMVEQRQNAARRNRLVGMNVMAREFVEPYAWAGVGAQSGIADDDPGALFTKHTSFFRLGTPVPALLPAEETEHARWLFNSLWVLYKRRALVSHLGP